MKHKNLSENGISQDCGPSKKELRQTLKSCQEAKSMIYDLVENNHFHYEMIRRIKGDILLRVEEIKDQIDQRRIK